MDARVVLVVYFLIAAAAAFVTASRNLPIPILLAILFLLALVAVLVRSRLLAVGGASRASLGFIVVYLVTYFAVSALLRG